MRDVITKSGPFPELQAVVILKQLLKALEFIHSRTPPIAHRDIKAGNVLIHENGRVKLGDFGIAAHDTGHLHTQIGSPYWLAPEMLPSPEAENTIPTYDYCVDIWSLGITGTRLCVLRCLGSFLTCLEFTDCPISVISRAFSAIELVQGKPPFMALTPVQALFQMATAKVAPTLDDARLFSANYNSFIAACLQRDPKTRPSAAALREHPLITGAGSRSLLEDYLENRYRFRRTDSPAHPSPSGARPRAQVAPASAMLSDDSSEDEEPLHLLVSDYDRHIG